MVTAPIVLAVSSKWGSRPVSSARIPHQSSIEDGSPPQLTIVAGTLAAASRAGMVARMSVFVERVEAVRAFGVHRDGVAALHEEEVPAGPAAVVAVRDVQAGDDRRHPVFACRGAHDDLGRDLARLYVGT